MKSFEKQMIARMGMKPTFKSSTVLKFVMPCDQVAKLDFLAPVYQSDLNQIKVNEMIESTQRNPNYFLLRSVLVCAVYRDKMYLMDGQHRHEMMKRISVLHPCEVLCYSVVNNDEMRQLFCEINKDSYKNMTYVSLPHETACILDELIEHYSKLDHFTKTRSESKLFTIKAFFDLLAEYVSLFQTSAEVITDLDAKQSDFIALLKMKTYYAEEAKCIKANFIMPLKNCNFISYLTNQTIPTYTGKGTDKPDKPFKSIPQSARTSVWNHYIGMNIGSSICMVCKVMPIFQISFQCGHVLAKNNGGTNTLDNLRPICQTCNLSMGTMHMDDFMKIMPQKNLNEPL